MSENENSTSASTLFRIAGAGASLAFGAMVASLFALKSAPVGLTFELNAGSVIAFPIAATLAWFYWRMVVRMAVDKAPQQGKKKFFAFSASLLLVGLISFLYPLKFIANEKRRDVFIGLGLAATVLTGVGAVMWKVKRFLDADLKQSEGPDEPADRSP